MKALVIIGLLGGVFILFNTPSCTRWFAERAIRHTLAQQTVLLQHGGVVSVSSTQLDSLWNSNIHYLAIIPESVSATSVAAFDTTLSQTALYSAQMLGLCMKNDHRADSLFTGSHIRFLRQDGFGLTALRPNEKIGLYTIRRTDTVPGQLQISYDLSLHNEF